MAEKQPMEMQKKIGRKTGCNAPAITRSGARKSTRFTLGYRVWAGASPQRQKAPGVSGRLL